MENFIVQFQLKVNKVKASGTVLSDGVLGYALLNSANLSSEKHDMVRATCDELSFSKVKIQLEKIGMAKSGSTTPSMKFHSKSESPPVKVESCWYGDMPSDEDEHQDNERGSSDEDKVFYSKTFHQDSSTSKFKLNSVDRFGHIRACSYCKCVYHWMANCPYAPQALKNNLKSKESSWRTPKTL